MKSIVKVAGACLILATLLAFSISSCKKDDATVNTSDKEIDKAKLTDLLETLYAPATDENCKEFNDVYKSLSAEEMNEFYTLQNEKELLDIEENEKNRSSSNSGQDIALLKQQAKLIGGYRLSLNKLSLERYGSGANKLDDSKFRLLSIEILNGEKYRILRANVTPVTANKGDVTALAPCSAPGWPYFAPRITFSGGLGYYGEYRMDNDPNAADCDYEYRFNGVYNRVRGERVVDNNVLGNGVSRRSILYSDGYDTGLLVGYWTKVGWLGTNNLYCRVTNR